MKNKIILYFIIFAGGFGIAYFTLPTKSIIKKVEVQSEADKKTIAELTGKINTLETTNTNLKRQIKTLITAKPDGTTITEIIETEESSEERTRKIVEDYEQKISELEKEIQTLRNRTIEEINKKSVGIEGGYDSTKSFYIHSTYDVFNSVFVGGHGQLGKTKSVGGGLGVRL